MYNHFSERYKRGITLIILRLNYTSRSAPVMQRGLVSGDSLAGETVLMIAEFLEKRVPNMWSG